MSPEVLVLGSGPAGLSVGRALASRGVATTVLAPDPHAPWLATYGSWSDRLPGWLEPAAVARYPRAVVHLDHEMTLEHPYTRFDTDALQQLLLTRALAAGVRVERGTCVRATHDARGTTVEGAGVRRCAVLVDAAGAVLEGTGPPSLFQTAWGVVAEVERPLDGLRWMDFSHRFGDGTEPPTFLYAMPLPDGRAFLEETSLAWPGGLSDDVLERRLRERLDARGIALVRIGSIERCRIPLDRPVPPAQRAVGFGAAAGLIHPATGYSLARAIDAAEGVADAIVTGLSQGGPERAAALAWSTLWPAARRSRWALYRYGARRIAALGADEIRAFLSAFFRGARWREWLDDELSLGGLVREMMAHFARLPSGPRWRVLRGSQGWEGR